MSIGILYWSARGLLGLTNQAPWLVAPTIVLVILGWMSIELGAFQWLIVAMFRAKFESGPVWFIEFFFIDRFEELNRDALIHSKRTENNPTIR